MASLYDYGYKDQRFESAVDENFHCPICLNVLKEPVMCQRNQHCFCTPCITKHLQNSNMCPSCRDELTVETLSQAPRILTSYLSNLKIRCDYFERGCTGFLQLGDLKTHVDNCGFSPVLCSNEGCLVEINKRDRTHHEAEICEFRKLKCHDCAELRREIDEVKMNAREQLKEVELIKENLTKMNDKMTHITKLPGQMRCMQEEILKDVRAVMAEMKDEMKQGLKQSASGSCHLNSKEDIVIAGGKCAYDLLDSAENFSWSTKTWVPLKPMKRRRAGASSVVYENQIFVLGGRISKFNWSKTDTMEITNITQLPEQCQWSDFHAKLPTKISDFKSVVYKDRLITTGGYAEHSPGHSGFSSDSISEVLLVPPYAVRLLARMPQPIYLHGAELINDKIVIVGGSTGNNTEDTLDSVLMYDVKSNACKQVASLPFAVSCMATVSWRGNVIVIGGMDKNGEVLRTVLMYDVNTGESKLLPEMKYCRAACSAVITGDVIVVMGGFDEERKAMKSVECYEFSLHKWNELPPMKQARSFTTAVAKPDNFT